MRKRKKKYRSIDDPIEDSSDVKPFEKPSIPKTFVKGKTSQPKERYFYNMVPALHKKLLESMNLETPEGDDVGGT